MQHITTNRDVRLNNRKSVVNTLFHSELMTKQELAQKTGLSLPTITYILQDLTEGGLITRGEKLDSSGGRPAFYIQPVFDSAYSIGINISKETVRVALSDLAPNMLSAEKYPLKWENSNQYWSNVNSLVSDFISRQTIDISKLLGIGISLDATFDRKHSVAMCNFNGKMEKLDLDKIARSFQYPVEFNNAARMASYAQTWGGMETEDLVYLAIDDTIAGSIVIDRDVLHFYSKNAAFGHMKVSDKGRMCLCGKADCLDAYCSALSLSKRSGTTIEHFFAEVAVSNPQYLAIFEEYMHHLAVAINNIRVVFDLDIVIGGVMSVYLSEHIHLLQSILSDLNPFGDPGTFVRIGSYGEFGSAIGAGLIHNNRFLSY